MAALPTKPTHDELAERWTAQHEDTKFAMGSFYRYEQGYWVEMLDSKIEEEILEILKDAKSEWIRPTQGLLASVLSLSRLGVRMDNKIWDSNPDILVCGNGTLEISHRHLRDHNPMDYATRAVPYDYSETATAPAFSKILSRLPIDVVPFLQEYAGYCLTTDTSYEIAVWLYGPAGGGKSSFIAGLMAMAGELCCQLGLSDFVRSRFALADLPGRTIAISTEQPAASPSLDLVNKVISGEPIMIDKKFKDPLTIIPHAKILWAMNELPRIRSEESGIFRRVKIVDFPIVPMADRDPRIKKQIETEGAGILNWALDGLDRLQKRGYFEIPETVQRVSDEFKSSCNIPQQFVEDACVVGGNETVQAMDLYSRYTDWCSDNGHKPFSSTRLGRVWKDMGFSKTEKNGCRYYHGIGLKSSSFRPSA